MRSSIAVAAFAVGALAVPYAKRDVVTDYDIVYETDVVTVWATDGAEPTPAAETTSSAEPSSSVAQQAPHYGHNHWGTSGGWGGWQKTTEAAVESSSTSEAPVAESTPSTTSEAPAPVTPTSTSISTTPTSISTTPTSTYVAPPPPTSAYVAPTTSTSVYVAPTTSTSVWVAPSAYSTPSPVATPSAVANNANDPYADMPKPTDYASQVVFHHNIHRRNHSSADLTWSNDLAKSAGDIAALCVYAHNTEMDGGGYGQNIAAGVPPENITQIISNMFYNGEVGWFANLYNEDQPDMTNFENWGHFSQIVWASTTQVGCATQHCPSGLGNVGSDVSPYFTVCNYGPPGNYANEYKKNIGHSLNRPTLDYTFDG